MKINLNPNKKLFTIFLIINLSGYDYENNSSGMNDLRIYFTDKFGKLFEHDSDFIKIVKTIKNSKLDSRDYVRFANMVMIPGLRGLYCDDKVDKEVVLTYEEINNNFATLLSSKKIDTLYKEYCGFLKKIPDHNKSDIENQLGLVVSLFNLKNDSDLEINIHLNLLESYRRGTNYFLEQSKIISCSLDVDGSVYWSALRHELTHILLKQLEKKNDYKNFDEYFAIATNLFFMKDDERTNNIKYYQDHGFEQMSLFYRLMNQIFITEKLELSELVISNFLKSLQGNTVKV